MRRGESYTDGQEVGRGEIPNGCMSRGESYTDGHLGRG